MRGENNQTSTNQTSTDGSSPHARGKHHPPAKNHRARRLIPACAGKTAPDIRIPIRSPAHPRMRGENSDSSWESFSSSGSSPHARGKLAWLIASGPTLRLIPACAGKTLRSEPFRRFRRAHPRMRGENRPHKPACPARLGSSPHARGKPRSRLIWLCLTKAHPRMRGEN